jgi:hypothetical protein
LQQLRQQQQVLNVSLSAQQYRLRAVSGVYFIRKARIKAFWHLWQVQLQQISRSFSTWRMASFSNKFVEMLRRLQSQHAQDSERQRQQQQQELQCQQGKCMVSQ